MTTVLGIWPLAVPAERRALDAAEATDFAARAHLPPERARRRQRAAAATAKD